MTIKLLQMAKINGAWRNPLEIINDLPPAFERGLIDAGSAISFPSTSYPWVLDPHGNPIGLLGPDGEAESARIAHADEHESMGWMNQFSRPQNITGFEKAFSGAFSTQATANRTRHCGYMLPDLAAVKATHIAFRFHNAHTSALNYKGRFLFKDTIGDSYWNSDPGWQYMLLDDSSTIPVPAVTLLDSGFAGVSPYQIEGTTLTQWIPIADVANALYVFFRTTASANTTGQSIIITPTGGPSGTLLTMGLFSAFKNAECVDNLTAFVTPSFDGRMPNVSLLFKTKMGVHCIDWKGGSADIGNGDNATDVPAEGAGRGWPDIATYEGMSDGAAPVVFSNSCLSSASSSFCTRVLPYILATDNPFNEIALRFTAGDDSGYPDYIRALATDSEADWITYETRVIGQGEESLAAGWVARKDIRFILNKWSPGMTGNQLASQKRLRNVALAWAAEGRCTVDDGPGKWNSLTDDPATYLDPSLFVDPTSAHWNGYGHARRVEDLLPQVRDGR